MKKHNIQPGTLEWQPSHVAMFMAYGYGRHPTWIIATTMSGALSVYTTGVVFLSDAVYVNPPTKKRGDAQP